jgi:hypothetical protein
MHITCNNNLKCFRWAATLNQTVVKSIYVPLCRPIYLPVVKLKIETRKIEQSLSTDAINCGCSTSHRQKIRLIICENWRYCVPWYESENTQCTPYITLYNPLRYDTSDIPSKKCKQIVALYLLQITWYGIPFTPTGIMTFTTCQTEQRIDTS